MSRRCKLDSLRALAEDPRASEHERRLAAERVAAIEAKTATATIIDNEQYVECDDELMAAFGRAMARASTVRDSRYRAARIRAAEHRLGRDVAKQWREGRGLALPRPWR